MDKEKLKILANKLLFTMDDSEYETLSEEFEIILKQMDLIGEIKDIDKVDPLIYPFPLDNVSMREAATMIAVERIANALKARQGLK